MCPTERSQKITKEAIERFQQYVSDRHGEVVSAWNGKYEPITLKCGTCDVPWTSTPHAIRNGNSSKGTWCPRCNKGGAPSLNFQIALDHIKKENGTYLSGDYKNNMSKLTIRCGKKHVFVSDWKSLRQGKWCPDCAPNRTLTLSDVKNIAAEHKYNGNGGAVLVDREEDYDRHNIPVRCGCGNEWVTNSKIMSNGFWCMKCKFERGWKTRNARYPKPPRIL